MSKATARTNQPGPGGGHGGRRQGFNFKPAASVRPGTAKRLFKYIMTGRNAVAFAIVAVCIVIAAVASLNATLFMQSLIDDYITPMLATGSGDFSALAQALIQLGTVCMVGVICAYSYNLIMVYVCQGTLRKLRVDLFEHMESLPISYFDTHAHGDIMSVYTNDVDTLRQLVGQTIPQFINSGITVVITLISMVVLSIPLTGITLLMVVAMALVVAKIGGLSSRYFVKQQQDLGKVDGYIEEMMKGQKVVKVFCREDKVLEEFRIHNENLRASADQANKYANIMMPIVANLGNVSYVICAVVGAVLAINGMFGLTLGTLVAFLSLNKGFTMPLNQLSQQVNFIAMALAGADRIFRLFDEAPEADEGTKVLKREDVRGEVIFDDVDFSYDGKKTVLFDIDMYAKPGQKIAFVGSTGAGKTTITNLINRFYDIDKGTITYDGTPIADFTKDSLRQSLGIVLQDTHLFTGTVMENIRYGRLDATDEECIEAARLANADDFIHRLPHGYQTMLTGDGSNLSQGQRQLLAIARAAIADPPVLILDEATSSIDTRTESLVQEGMDRLMSGRTTFVIAHRLSTVRNADCIMVLEGGRIIERGTHDDLVAQRGRYYQLYTGKRA